MERENTETKDEAMEPEPTKPKRRRRKNRVIDEESTPKPRRKHLRKEKVSEEDDQEEVRSACWETLQQVPKTIGEIAAVIYNSLANCYAMAAKEIETITGQKYQELHIVGGGANADFLNKLTAKYTGKIGRASCRERV